MKAVCRRKLATLSNVFFIFLLSGILASVFAPWPGAASEEMPLAANASREEIATFDEEEAAAVDPQPEAVSQLMHAEAYQPAAYFPERQERSVASHPWVRMLPFAALVMLAVVAARFFARRRHKAGLAGSPVAFEKAAVVAIGVLFALGIETGTAYAQRGFFQGGFPQKGGKGGFQSQIYASVADGVASFLGSDREIYQKDIDLTGDVQQMLKRKLGWTPNETSTKVYYSKTQAGAVEAYAFVLSELLPKCGGTHKYCIKVSSKGVVEGVQILELNCHHSFGVNNEWFLSQFEGVTAENAGSTRIDAVTRATLSSDLTRDVVRLALALFEVAEGHANV